MTGTVAFVAPSAFGARFVAWDGVELALASTEPQPPGARLEGTLDGLPLRLKATRCRRRETEAFLLVGKPLDLRRETRVHLEGLATQGEDGRRVERW